MKARRRSLAPDVSQLAEVVTPRVLQAMHTAATRLDALGVRYKLVGGLAVGAHGYPRNTKDVDFLVGDEAFEHHEGGIVTMKPGLPIEVDGVLVDFLSAKADEPHLMHELDTAAEGSVRICSPEALIYLKLRSPRQKDRADVVELIKAGLDIDATKTYLQSFAPDLLPVFSKALQDAESEEE